MFRLIGLLRSNINSVVYFICTIIFLVQTTLMTVDFFWSQTTNTVLYNEDLHLQDFPALIRVCPMPGFDEAQVYEHGYGSSLEYFVGWSRYNHSFWGWTGHTNENGQNFTAEGK